MRHESHLLSEAAREEPPPALSRELTELLDAVAAAPHRHDFYRVMRHIEAMTPHLPRLGAGARPQDEPVRLAQDVSLAFAPAPLAALEHANGARAPRLAQRFFGYLGPNGPLPLHLTDFIRERGLHHGDRAFARLLDALLHRFLLLFYRAWAQGRPVNALDRPGHDRFAFYTGALIGLADEANRRRDAVSDHAKLHFAGLWNMQTRPADALEAIAGALLRVPVRVAPYRGHWMTLQPDERAALRRKGACLGRGAVLGRAVWDRQHAFRLVIGPLSLAQFESLLPGGDALPTLVAVVRQHLNGELAWDAQLVLAADDVPTAQIGRYGRLGISTWLGLKSRHADCADCADLKLDAEAKAP
ncbi:MULTISPECIES: type VI secretion system baseplate subunit TssG [unclassified Caballeronia]|uniref:type VI secretion system baseplate subunit TssG n=1 Tax=unclassified Caballeronia TaxID=2646786 RepID=UPI0028625F61|nr:MULTISPECIES: type VI secretion system baseplate subunit TssG [unclassified Caballeronia]MDR5740978.1 type VI secretion system baseplate subunit TssG [Caballeronia sp. LZ016]MDR5806876.1 type VI secretion system baseplate subunit TssG [Caballeronia sp. LZ019]